MTDVDQGVLEYQRELVKNANLRASILRWNLVDSKTPANLGKEYDVIIDSSVSDVFIATGGFNVVQSELFEKLSERGIMITRASITLQINNGVARAETPKIFRAMLL